jgi:hypothetical protein
VLRNDERKEVYITSGGGHCLNGLASFIEIYGNRFLEPLFRAGKGLGYFPPCSLAVLALKKTAWTQ